MTVWIVVGVLAVLFVLFLTLSNRKTIKIKDPSAGFLNLMGASAAQLLQEDRAAVRPSFYSVSESETTAPHCDVLFLYAEVQEDGSLTGTKQSLRQLIADSGAKIVLIATDNPQEHYTATMKSEGARANIVMTLNRRGWKFSFFIKQLFEKMETGLSMPVVWVRLAPQRPGDPHEDCPDTLFVAELGQVRFPYSR